MNKRLIVAIIALLMPLTVLRAQRFITIFDPEVNQPVRGVSVGIDYNKADTTNVYGQVFIPAKFDTLFIKKSGYVALRIPLKYVEDSIPLIRDYHHIGEVVVYAERSKELDQAVHRWVKEDKTEVELRHPITGISFNMSDLFNSRQRRDRKHAKKMKAIFKQLDEQDNDPIVQSYRRALRNKQIKR